MATISNKISCQFKQNMICYMKYFASMKLKKIYKQKHLKISPVLTEKEEAKNCVGTS